jgi:hypothetical protein
MEVMVQEKEVLWTNTSFFYLVMVRDLRKRHRVSDMDGVKRKDTTI